MTQKQNTPDEVDKMNEVLSSSEQFIEKNQKGISIVILVVVIAVGAWLGLRHFYFEPREATAYAEMFKGEFYLDADSFALALNGNGADSKLLQTNIRTPMPAIWLPLMQVFAILISVITMKPSTTSKNSKPMINSYRRTFWA